MTANTVGMLCTCKACEILGFASTSIFASTHEPLPSVASFSSIGESCLHGSHHSAHRSMSTGTWYERSMTSVWNSASLTSMTAWPGCRRRRLGGAGGGLGARLDGGEIDGSGHRGGQCRTGLGGTAGSSSWTHVASFPDGW